jgi:DNA-binding NarL/FixJ family response regulator
MLSLGGRVVIQDGSLLPWLMTPDERVLELVAHLPVDALCDLSPVQTTVALLLSQGFRNREIARQLYRSEKTVEKHVAHIFRKLGIEALNDHFDRRVLTCRAILGSGLPALSGREDA